MPKVKIPRHHIALDMTAMCDMAFLLLTFFMLATKFKPQEAVVVDVPSAVSEVKMPDKNLVTIWVEKDGAVFFGIDDPVYRMDLLDGISKKYKVSFTQHEKEKFSSLDAFGSEVSAIRGLLTLSKEERNDLTDKGVPVDSANNQLKDWLSIALSLNPDIDFAIRGDKDVNYKVVNKVINTLQSLNVNKFKLVTTFEM